MENLKGTITRFRHFFQNTLAVLIDLLYTGNTLSKILNLDVPRVNQIAPSTPCFLVSRRLNPLSISSLAYLEVAIICHVVRSQKVTYPHEFMHKKFASPWRHRIHYEKVYGLQTQNFVSASPPNLYFIKTLHGHTTSAVPAVALASFGENGSICRFDIWTVTLGCLSWELHVILPCNIVSWATRIHYHSRLCTYRYISMYS